MKTGLCKFRGIVSDIEYCIVLYCSRVPAANAPGCTASEDLLYKPWSLVVSAPPETLVVKGGTIWERNGR